MHTHTHAHTHTHTHTTHTCTHIHTHTQTYTHTYSHIHTHTLTHTHTHIYTHTHKHTHTHTHTYTPSHIHIHLHTHTETWLVNSTISCQPSVETYRRQYIRYLMTYALSGVWSLAVYRFKFSEGQLKFNTNSNGAALHTTENILHVCIHKKVLTMFQQKFHLLVSSERYPCLLMQQANFKV